VTKTNANMVDTFKAVEQGFLGAFENIKPFFYWPPARPVGYQHFDISALAAEDGLPEVDILYGHQALQPGLVQAAVDLGAKGLVVSGMGAGSWTKPGKAALEKAYNETGLPIVDSTRSLSGYVDVDTPTYGIGSGFLNPQKSRIQLQLGLALGMEWEAIRETFKATSY
jgi:L-asparaginase